MMRHIVTHLATVDEAQFERVKALCVSLGEVLVRPLAEALSAEARPRTRERLTAILLAFGAVAPPDGRTAEELAEPGGPPDGHPAAAGVRRQRRAARPDRAARRQRAAGAARSGAGDSQHRHRSSVPDPRAGADHRHAAVARRNHAVASARCATSARRRCSPTSSNTWTIADRSGAVYLRAIESLGALKRSGRHCSR